MNEKKVFKPANTTIYKFSNKLNLQIEELEKNPMMLAMSEGRRIKANDHYRPKYHFVNSLEKLNDPNGLCYWQGNWHLFFQAVMDGQGGYRPHWGHAISKDLIHWDELPYAIYPGPEYACYSGTTLVEKNRVIAMYHGKGIGNMVAISDDPLLLNWKKLNGHAVIPFPSEEEELPPYGIFDPCIWKHEKYYYSLSAGIEPYRPEGKHVAAEYLFRSKNLIDWEYLHPFIEGDRFTVLGDDGACPYFLPLGDRYILVFFSHMTGSQYLLGEYDTDKQKFIVDSHGKFNFGATFPGGIHAPTATVDGKGILTMFNMNPGKYNPSPNHYLKDYFGDEIKKNEGNFMNSWDQIMTLPRRITLENSYKINISPICEIEKLRGKHKNYQDLLIKANDPLVLPGICGRSIELSIAFKPSSASLFEINVLSSIDHSEYTRICYFHKRGNIYREPIETNRDSHLVMSTQISRKIEHESILTLDTSRSSILPDVLSRPPESAPVLIKDDEIVELRVFIDCSVVEVFINKQQCIATRVYPSSIKNKEIFFLSLGHDTLVKKIDCWQMKSIYKDIENEF